MLARPDLVEHVKRLETCDELPFLRSKSALPKAVRKRLPEALAPMGIRIERVDWLISSCDRGSWEGLTLLMLVLLPQINLIHLRQGGGALPAHRGSMFHIASFGSWNSWIDELLGWGDDVRSSLNTVVIESGMSSCLAYHLESRILGSWF